MLISLSFIACSSSSGNMSAGTDEGSVDSRSDGQVVKLTAEGFKKLVWDYEKNPKEWKFRGDVPCIIDFYADWCRPCKMVAPVMEELAREYKGKIRIYKVNTDEQRELAGLFSIRSIPAMLFVPRTGQPQMKVGAMPKESYVQAINSMLNIK